MRLGIIFCFIFIFCHDVFSDIRKQKFPSSSKTYFLLYLGGNYISDYNSRDFVIDFGYKYKNQKFMQEFDFHHKSVEAETTKIPIRKTEELYEIELSNKFTIAGSKNYINLYNLFTQDKYDKFNSSEKLENGNIGYYYDMTSVGGIGRIFGKNIEADINIGWYHSKGGESSMVINPVLYLKTNLTERVKLNIKLYSFEKENERDLKTKFSISYKVNRNISFSLYHQYNKKEYLYLKRTSKINIREKISKRSRSSTIGIKYYL